MKRIVVLDRGWVFMGEVEEAESGIVILGAQCIRRWGTTKGLGEIAEKGPLPNTVLDAAGTVRAPWSSVIAQIDCAVQE